MKQIFSLIFIFIISVFSFSACSLISNNKIKINISTITININSETKLNIDASTNLILEDKNNNAFSQIFIVKKIINNNSTTPTIILNCKNKNFTIYSNIGNIRIYTFLYCILNDTMVDLGKNCELYVKTQNSITNCYKDYACKDKYIANIDYNDTKSPGNKKLNAKFNYTIELK